MRTTGQSVTHFLKKLLHLPQSLEDLRGRMAKLEGSYKGISMGKPTSSTSDLLESLSQSTLPAIHQEHLTLDLAFKWMDRHTHALSTYSVLFTMLKMPQRLKPFSSGHKGDIEILHRHIQSERLASPILYSPMLRSKMYDPLLTNLDHLVLSSHAILHSLGLLRTIVDLQWCCLHPSHVAADSSCSVHYKEKNLLSWQYMQSKPEEAKKAEELLKALPPIVQTIKAGGSCSSLHNAELMRIMPSFREKVTEILQQYDAERILAIKEIEEHKHKVITFPH